MNLPPPPELSLYQLTQGFEPSPQPLLASAIALRSLVGASIDFLIEQQLEARVWLKLPHTDGWFQEIERYQQQGRADLIYLCRTDQDIASSPSPQPNSSRRYQGGSQIVPIELEANSQLKRESFVVILSPQFCSLILAQGQTAKALEKQPVTQPQTPDLKIVCSFEPPVIERVLAGIKQAIADTNPDQDLPFPFPSSPNSTLFANLLLKQVRRTETAATQSETIKALTESLHLKDEFLSQLVRELRPPLTSMKTALSLLESKQLKREQRERYLELLHRECDRQNSLIAGLLEFVQLETSPEAASAPPAKLEDLVPGIVSTYQPLAQEKGILLGYTIPADCPPVSCPTNWLRQIILNLLNNSLKFTPSNGRVSVQASVQSDSQSVELTVSDTGIGIESSDLPKIFNSFYRGRANSSENIPSAGLGLTIVKQLLQRCGGSISVASKVGRGSMFKVLLPAIPTQLENEEN